MRYIGIDVSKAKLDMAMLDTEGNVIEQVVVKNTPKGLTARLARWERQGVLDRKDCLVCFEPTGHYSNNVLSTLHQAQVPAWMAHPLEIKRRMGMIRGKNDKVDALRIADYAMRFEDRKRLVSSDTLAVVALKQLLSFRRKVQGDQLKHQVYRDDVYPHLSCNVRQYLAPYSGARIKQAKSMVARIDAAIVRCIKADPLMAKQYKLLLSVELVGPVLAAHLIAATERFSRMRNPRHLGCHAGVVPHQHSSGSSIHKKARVSHHADKNLKAKLHMAALGATQRRGELGAYYARKTAEGKNRMCVLNAVRNKILHRACAVIERGTPYQKRQPA